MSETVLIVSDVKPIGPRVLLVAVFTHSVFFIIFTLSDISVKSWYKMHEQVA